MVQQHAARVPEQPFRVSVPEGMPLVEGPPVANASSLTVSIIIPALNEAESLPHVLPLIPAWINEIILVDGNSTDDTIAVAQRVRPGIRTIQQTGRGKGAALRSGVRAATGDIVVLMDADGSTDPREIVLFVGALLTGAHYAKGSRFLQGGGTADMPLYRQLGNQALVILTNVLFGTRYTDITYGYNAFWRSAADALALDIDGWPCEIISNIRAVRNGLRVVEIASFEHERIAGIAKLRAFSAGWVILKAIMREKFAQVAAPQQARFEQYSIQLEARIHNYNGGPTMIALATNAMLHAPPLPERAEVLRERVIGDAS